MRGLHETVCGLTIAVVSAFSGPARAEPVSFESLMREMVDREAVARLPEPAYTCRQFSSYDRASVGPDRPETWFANNDYSQFLRVEEVPSSGGVRREWVMADMDGPGAVVRVWSANPKGVMRVYLDGEATPAIEAPMADLLGGKWTLGEEPVGPPLAQESSRGFNLYLPIPYAKHCKITSDSDGFYYQVNYRTYEAGAGVQTLPTAAGDEQHELIPLSQEALGQMGAPSRGAVENRITLAPGETFTATFPAGPVVIRSIDLAFTGAVEPGALRSLVVSALFDGERTVWCPVSDFFGSGVGLNALQDHWRMVSPKGMLRSMFAMPYQQSAKVEFVNHGDRPVSFNLRAAYDRWKWDDRSMHFHAAWHGEYPIHALGGRGTRDWNYIEIRGEGVFVGDNLAVMNPVPEWWGEGDEKIYVDGESFPSHFGTGTEDYYGYAWCSPQLFQHPFHAQPRCDGNGKNNWGHTSVTRVRALDGIPFEKSLKFDMEVWHWKACDVAYAATMYWYARPGSTSNRLTDEAIAAMTAEVKKPIPQPPPLPPPFKVEGAIECEAMKVLAKSDGLNAINQEMEGFGKQTWSGDAQLWVQGRRPGDFIELEIPAPPVEGVEPRHVGYLVKLHATESWDYGIVRFFVNGQAAGSRDLFSGGPGQVRATGPIELLVVRPVSGQIKLRVEVMGGNRESEGTKSFFGLDCVTLEPRDLRPIVDPGTRE